MEQEKTGEMTGLVACWPERDTYFRAGRAGGDADPGIYARRG